MKPSENSVCTIFGIDRLDLAHVADVDHRLVFPGAADHHFLGADQRAVLAGQTDRKAALAVDEMDDLLVHLPAEHHLDDVHRLRIGHPHALDEFAFLADALQQVVDLRAAAMNDDGIHPDQLEQHDVAREAFLQLLVGHGVAAVLDDDRLAVETLDVRERLREDARFDVRIDGRRCGHAVGSCE